MTATQMREQQTKQATQLIGAQNRLSMVWRQLNSNGAARAEWMKDQLADVRRTIAALDMLHWTQAQLDWTGDAVQDIFEATVMLRHWRVACDFIEHAEQNLEWVIRSLAKGEGGL